MVDGHTHTAATFAAMTKSTLLQSAHNHARHRLASSPRRLLLDRRDGGGSLELSYAASARIAASSSEPSSSSMATADAAAVQRACEPRGRTVRVHSLSLGSLSADR